MREFIKVNGLLKVRADMVVYYNHIKIVLLGNTVIEFDSPREAEEFDKEMLKRDQYDI